MLANGWNAELNIYQEILFGIQKLLYFCFNAAQSKICLMSKIYTNFHMITIKTLLRGSKPSKLLIRGTVKNFYCKVLLFL